MSKLKIEGGHELTGTIKISGAKNSAVALIPAAILAKTNSTILNVPKISDIKYLIEIMELLNCKIKIKDDTMFIDTSKIKYHQIPEELSQMMRASYYYMGAMLAKFKKAEISFPGGCKIGNRPIDLHLKGFQKLGVKIKQEKNKYTLTAKELIGTKIYLDFASVGATINIMLAAVGAKGTTIIENAAKEPEIVNIADFLINMGAHITGTGTSTITIEGEKELDNGIIEVFPDRIEASTYLIAGALIGKNLTIDGVIKEHINAVLDKLVEVGATYKIDNNKISISKIKKVKPSNIKTLVYPGFPTDVQQPFTTLLTQAEGTSIITETIYESRFKNTEYLNMMGAKTEYNGNTLTITGKTELIGKEVYANDLRGGASLVLAGLIAKGTTIIDNTEHILRGYEDIVTKLQKVGAKIEEI